MKKNFLICLYAAVIFSATTIAQNADNAEVTAAEIKNHITYLSSDEMKGRFSGSKEIYNAAMYIKAEFEKYGLKPAFGDNYLQEYSFIAGIEMVGENEIDFNLGSEELEPELDKDFIPAPFSGSGEVEAKLVFAGYGISASKIGIR